MAFVSNATSATTAKTAGAKKLVKATTQVLVASNRDRVALYVFNPSSKEVWLSLGETATKEEGIWLKKEGGAIVIPDYTGAVSCITTAEEGSITYSEV